MDAPVLLSSNEIDPQCGYRYNHFSRRDDRLFLHRHDYYELIYIVDTPQEHYSNGSVVAMPPRSLIFVRPNDLHALYNKDNDGAMIQHLAFSSSLADSLFVYLAPLFDFSRLLSAEISPYVLLNETEAKKFLNIIDMLNFVQYDDAVAKSVAIRSVLVQIFTQFFWRRNADTRNSVPEWLSETCALMNQQVNFSEGLSRMIELSGRSKEHLCRSMKKYYNVTVSEFINDLRLTYIANRLVNSDIPIISLCYECGFSNLGWMYTLFRQKYGCTPARFRKENTAFLTPPSV